MRSLEKVILADKMYRSLIGTTQAITLTQGGVKSNALPEQAWAVVNHRIATERCAFTSSTTTLDLALNVEPSQLGHGHNEA